jgi:hypothetical protein
MALESSSPTIHNDNEYPFFTVNLAVSPKIEANDIGGSVAIKLTPYRILEGGEIEPCPEKAKSLAYADVFQEIANGDMELLAIVSGIMTKIQEFILAKGL